MPARRALSAQRRNRALNLAQRGHTSAEIAALLQCSVHDVELELGAETYQQNETNDDEKAEQEANRSLTSNNGARDALPDRHKTSNDPRCDGETFNQLVGRRLRQARISAGMSQTQLGHFLGKAFQQVQKYEKGVNELHAATLFRLAHLFGVPISYFFGDDPERLSSNPSQASTIMPEDLASRETAKLAHFYERIGDQRIRQELFEIVQRLGGRGGDQGS